MADSGHTVFSRDYHANPSSKEAAGDDLASLNILDKKIVFTGYEREM
jgi:hypothetical protein